MFYLNKNSKNINDNTISLQNKDVLMGFHEQLSIYCHHLLDKTTVSNSNFICLISALPSGMSY